MFSQVLKSVAFVAVQTGTKKFSTSAQRQFKVTVAGAAGGIGQPLSLLLKQNPLVTHLALYDIAPVTLGVAVDISHMNTPAKVTGHKGTEHLACAVHCSDLVLIPAGVPRKPGMTRDDLFNTNASIVRDLTACIAKWSPKAIIAIITNPVNSMVPIASEVLKKAGVYDPNRALGVTTLDLVRAATFVGEINGVNPQCVNVPVIGGHSGVTIIPVLSQSQPVLQLRQDKDMDKILKLIKRIQEAGTEVVKAKAGGGSATLSMAYAGARLAHAILRGLKGESNVIECAYVKSSVSKAEYFSNPLLFGKNGVEKNLHYGELNKTEQQLLKDAMPELMKNIKIGENFILESKKN